MITQRYKVQTISQTSEGGEPTGSLVLVPLEESNPNLVAPITARGAVPAGRTPAMRQNMIPLGGIPVDQLRAEGLSLGDTVIITAEKERISG